MANVAWPAGLPQYVLVSGYTETAPNNTIRTEMAAGPAKLRRRSTAAVRTISCQLRLSYAQRDVLDGFYLTDTASGSVPFDWVHPVTRAAVTMRFVEPPSLAADAAGRHFIASLKLEIMA